MNSSRNSVMDKAILTVSDFTARFVCPLSCTRKNMLDDKLISMASSRSMMSILKMSVIVIVIHQGFFFKRQYTSDDPSSRTALSLADCLG